MDRGCVVNSASAKICNAWLQDHRRGMPPQPFEVVERACRFGKDVHQEIAVIHEYPFAGVIALDAHGELARFL
jgi:hypothetical protein